MAQESMGPLDFERRCVDIWYESPSGVTPVLRKKRAPIDNGWEYSCPDEAILTLSRAKALNFYWS